MPTVKWDRAHKGATPRFRCPTCEVSFLGGSKVVDAALHAHACPEAPRGYAACEAVVGPDCARAAENAGDGPVPGWGGLTAAEVLDARAAAHRKEVNGSCVGRE